MKKRLGITLGDPGGIGPEVLVKGIASVGWSASEPEAWIFGDRSLLEETARRLGLPSPLSFPSIRVVEDPETQGQAFPQGCLSLLGAKAQVGYIRGALAALQKSEIHALVTGPIHKQALALCDLPYVGHTEWLADACGVKQPVMMLAGPKLRVVPATIHIPLREVPKAIHPAMLLAIFEIIVRDGRRWLGLSEPRIAVCGLNPHASDGGLIGDEEATQILPAIQKAQSQGFRVIGPLPGDTAFTFAARGHYDVVVGMYHDQALAPLKLLHFEEAINLTLGLPYLRTSVDHGTAYDIAGKGLADPTSFVCALRQAKLSL